MNLWSHRFSLNTSKKLSRFLPCVVRAEILTIFCLYFVRNDDFINHSEIVWPLVLLVHFVKPVKTSLGKSNMHSTLDFCHRRDQPRRKFMYHYIWEAKSLLSYYTYCGTYGTHSDGRSLIGRKIGIGPIQQNFFNMSF